MKIVKTDDFDATLTEYTERLRYRLEMITPADSPREALVTRDDESVRIIAESRDKQTVSGDWIAGRAGMEYFDLIPERLGGKVIASHIRIKNGGPVADYVHYHRADFQMIFCVAGRIRVVYEDQDAPFWLEPGDCVLQPPEIRHRVLECAAGSEVIEVSSPAEHETWVDHKMELPTPSVNAERDFGGQKFLRSDATVAKWRPSEFKGYEEHDTGIAVASGGFANVCVIRRTDASRDAVLDKPNAHFFPVNENETLVVELLRF